MALHRWNGRAAAATVVALAFLAQPAWSACFELIGCTDSAYMKKSALNKLSCDALWSVRNTMFNEHDFCFKTKKARKVFDNSDCSVHDGSEIDFNKYENTNIARIKEVESKKGC